MPSAREPVAVAARRESPAPASCALAAPAGLPIASDALRALQRAYAEEEAAQEVAHGSLLRVGEPVSLRGAAAPDGSAPWDGGALLHFDRGAVRRAPWHPPRLRDADGGSGGGADTDTAGREGVAGPAWDALPSPEAHPSFAAPARDLPFSAELNASLLGALEAVQRQAASIEGERA